MQQGTLNNPMALRPRFAALPEQGYTLEVGLESASLPWRHRFCGANDTRGAWCPNCQKPLLRFLLLDAADPRLELAHTDMEVLPLLFCWTCTISKHPFTYHVSDRGKGVELLEYEPGARFPDFPYEGYPVAFPEGRVSLRELDEARQAVIRKLNVGQQRWELAAEFPRLARPTHQIGGEPYLVQAIDRPHCQRCTAEMPFLAALADSNLGERGFVENDFVQVLYHLCRPCQVIVAYQASE
jgi:hypothetical protein